MAALAMPRHRLAQPGRALPHEPGTEPDPAKWEVDVAYLTTGT